MHILYIKIFHTINKLHMIHISHFIYTFNKLVSFNRACKMTSRRKKLTKLFSYRKLFISLLLQLKLFNILCESQLHTINTHYNTTGYSSYKTRDFFSFTTANLAYNQLITWVITKQ